jgi:DNA-directed RNA polymerase subunit alpha
MRKHLNPFVQFDEIGSNVVSDDVAAANEQDDEIIRKLRMPVTDLELSVRASNCLETAKIRTVGELVQKTEDDLLGVRSFGKTSLKEVKSELEKMGLHLGYPVPDGLLNGA